MDREDRRRYFIVGSVILEIVTPVFRQRLEKAYKSKRLGCLQDFINSKPVLHILFHLRYKNNKCCKDSLNCKNRGTLPLNYSQWDLLYTENPGPPKHHCHCLYTTNNVKLDDLDITLASLILLNCCNLTHNEETLIKELRKIKNNCLSHNTKGTIEEKEFQTLWNDLKTYVLQLEPSKVDDFERIQNRPLDDPLCNKYFVSLLDIHKKLEEISDKLESSTAEILTAMNITNGQSNVELLTKLEEILEYLRRQSSKENTEGQEDGQPHLIQQIDIGQSIFKQNNKINLSSIINDSMTSIFQSFLIPFYGRRDQISDIVLMDDGRLVMCLPVQNKLLICNTDGSKVDSIDIQGQPWYVTMVPAVNNSTVAVTVNGSNCIEMYDINKKRIRTTISVPHIGLCSDIAAINNKLIVCGNIFNSNTLLIIDHQTGEVVQAKKTNCNPIKLHSADDKIFYSDSLHQDLFWYSYIDDNHHSITLPSPPISMTTLQDGSLYVICKDGSLQHVSAENKAYTPTKLVQSTPLIGGIYYNFTQKKLVTIQEQCVIIFKCIKDLLVNF